MDEWIKKFAKHKMRIADALASGKLDAGYSEATIILLALLSGIAGLLWPGKGLDRKRFSELLVTHTPPDLQLRYISTVMFVQEFVDSTDARLKHAAETIEKKYLPLYDTLIITGDDADGTESVLIQECPDLTPADIREFSYANLLYREIRCGLMHEYSLGSFATEHPMTDRNANISYANVVHRGPPQELYKQIHFHFDWIKRVVSSVADSVTGIENTLPISKPATWWLDG